MSIRNNLILFLLSAATCVGGYTETSASSSASPAQLQTGATSVEDAVSAVRDKVIEWRRDIHQHPELANEETRTAGIIADHLQNLGLEVKTGIAVTGVTGLLRGAKPGPTVALRADMDALPGLEKTGLPFASKAFATINGKETPVMHACGHDAHVAMLMGTAEALTQLRDRMEGNVLFIFQPAEELGAEAGGAKLMIEEGVLKDPRPDAIFGLHVGPFEPGLILYKPGAIMAGNDTFEIEVIGTQTHGGVPWQGVDSISVAAEIITALNGVTARQLDAGVAPTVITIGAIEGGIRSDTVPERVRMKGSLRTLNAENRKSAIEKINRTASGIAEAWGAEVQISWQTPYAISYNDPALTARMLPVLKEVAGEAGVHLAPNIFAAEDFSFFQQEIPGMYFALGVNKPGVSPADAHPNHSPYFFVNEDALQYGTRAFVELTLNFLNTSQSDNDQ